MPSRLKSTSHHPFSWQNEPKMACALRQSVQPELCSQNPLISRVRRSTPAISKWHAHRGRVHFVASSHWLILRLTATAVHCIWFKSSANGSVRLTIKFISKQKHSVHSRYSCCFACPRPVIVMLVSHRQCSSWSMLIRSLFIECDQWWSQLHNKLIRIKLANLIPIAIKERLRLNVPMRYQYDVNKECYDSQLHVGREKLSWAKNRKITRTRRQAYKLYSAIPRRLNLSC